MIFLATLTTKHIPQTRFVVFDVCNHKILHTVNCEVNAFCYYQPFSIEILQRQIAKQTLKDADGRAAGCRFVEKKTTGQGLREITSISFT